MVQTECPTRPCNELSDAEIVDRVKAGEAGLYETLMRRYNQRLFRVIRSVVTDYIEAEDVLQDAWVRAFEHLRQFEGRSRFDTWVTRIAYYEALKRARKRKTLIALENEDGQIIAEAENVNIIDDPEKQALRTELKRELRSAVDQLPQSYRSVFMLRTVEQMSTAETAECLSLSEEAVKTRLHRSRTLLQKDLEKRLGPALVESYAFMGAQCDRVVEAVIARIRAQ